jgi:hypothetical protein
MNLDLKEISKAWFNVMVHSPEQKNLADKRFNICLECPSKKEVFKNNLNLYKNINLNGFLNLNFETWGEYGKKINDSRYFKDGHLSPNGNQKLYENILNIIENE